ncbi:MAG: response regulator [Anaerolineae bacterium]|nr:response regulator [Anaerolineae bacterium]
MEGRILIIEDSIANSRVLQKNFTEAGAEVEVAQTGSEGFDLATRLLPQVIVLSTSLPDMPGSDLAQRLRGIKRTEHIFLLMLADEDIHSERLNVLALGANDFVASPFDPVEVTLRVGNALRRANMSNRTDPITGLPAGSLVQDQLRHLVMEDPEGSWALVRFRLLNLDPYRESYGFMAAADLLRMAARLLAEALNRDDVADDFLGYGGNDDFIIITVQSRAESLISEVVKEFNQKVGSHYKEEDLAQGFIKVDDEQAHLAQLVAHSISPKDGPFYDIRSLTEELSG